MATLADTVTLIGLLQPLEREGWIIGACGSTLRDGVGEDIDILAIQEPDAFEVTDLRVRLPELGLEDVRPHLHHDGTVSGYGFTGVWRGVRVDVGVVSR